MGDIDRIMWLIDWNRSEDEQQAGISLAREISCINAFFRPIGLGYSKSVWDNCAIIIAERSDAELAPYISDMLLWLEDLNWPGAEIIQNRLIQFRDVETMSLHSRAIVPVLKTLKQDSWLGFIAELLRNTDLKKALSGEVVQILLEYL